MSDIGFSSTTTGQEAIVGHCLTDFNFFKSCSLKLKPEWFTANVRLGTLFSLLVDAHKRYNEPINNADEFKNLEYFRSLNAQEKDLFYSLIDRCVYSATIHSITKVKKDLTGFLRESLFKAAMNSGSKMFNSGKRESSYEWTASKLKEIQEATFEGNTQVNKFDDILNWVEARAQVREGAISTGNALLDEALGGGLFPQDNSAILAPSNVGKSTALITIARHAIFKGKKVLFLTHEDVPDKIKEKMLLSFLGISRKTLLDVWRLDEDRQAIIKAAGDFLDNHLYFIPYNKAGQMFVEDVIQAARDLHNELVASQGHGFDLIIDDYPKKLKLKSRAGSKDSLYRAELAEIYDHFVQLAIELNTHCMYAIQTNRSGLKINNRKVDSENMLGMEEVDEAFGIAQNTANIIAIMRTPDDKAKNIMRLNVAKNRNGITDIGINTRTFFAGSLVFGDSDFFGKAYTNDIPGGHLPSFAQSDAKLMDTAVVDQQLNSVSKDSTIGTYKVKL